MKQMFIGIFLNLLGAFYMHYYITELEPTSMSNGFSTFMFILWFISLIGGILMLLGKRKAGAIMVIIGSIIFVPLGMVALLGAIKIKDPVEPSLENRRQLANNK